MVSLLNAGFVPWLIAASIPLVVHLLTRRVRRRMELPTAKFLNAVIANQSKLWRWRHLLTMLLRTLAIAALVAAFMKPVWVSAFSLHRGEHAGVVIVLDTSESMAYNSGGLTSLEKGKAQALSILRGLSDGDRANVITCGIQPKVALPSPTEDMGALATDVKGATTTEERGDASAALSSAIDQLSKLNTNVRRLYIVSDFQRTNWSEVHFEGVPADAQITFVSVDSGNSSNLGITALRASPSAPRVGETMTIQAEVFNSGSVPRTLPADLRLSDGRTFKETVDVSPFSSSNVSFSLAFDKPQRIEVTANVPADNLPTDDVRRAVIDLQQTATVVLITDEDVDSPQTASFYLSRALNPDPSASSGFRVIPLKPNALNNPILKSADVVIVCDTPSMPQVQYTALAKYVTEGGNLVWFLYGDRVDQHLAGFGKHLPKAEQLPFKLQSLADLEGKAKGYVDLAEANYESRLLKLFRDRALSSLSKAKFYKFWVTTEVDLRAEVLLKFEDGTPAAVRTGEGSGNLLLLNSSPAPSWSDMARQEVFVPLMHEFLKGILLKDAGLRESYPGGAVSTTIPPSNTSLRCVAPDGGTLPVTQDRTTGSVVIDQTQGSGFYRLVEGSTPVASMAVNPHPDESDLRSIDPRELESQRQREVSLLAGGTSGPSLSDMNRAMEIWPYLLFIALACLLGEQFVRRIGVRPMAKRVIK